MEPVITTLVTAIALGASQGLKETAAQTVKDSWTALNKMIRDRYRDNEDVTDAVDYVRKKPEAEARRRMLDQALQDVGADKDQELLQGAEKLLAAVEEHEPKLAEAVGMDIGRLKAARLEVSHVAASLGGTWSDVPKDIPKP